MANFRLTQAASEVQAAIDKALNSVCSVNGKVPDKNGNVEITIPDGVLYTPQGRTEDERRTARDNIGAGQAIVCEAEGEVITLSDSADDKLRGLRIYGKTVQDGTPTPDAPVELVSAGASGSIGVNAMGKNLINLVPREIHNHKGIKFDAFDGGTRLTGTSTGEYAQNGTAAYRGLKLPEGKYTLKAHVEGVTDNAVFAVVIMRDGNTQYVTATFSQAVVKDFVIEAGHTYKYFVFIRDSGKTVDCVVKAMLVPGTDAAEWEPYIEPQTLAAPTPNGLPGIPVSSGGNYTDDNGQEWVCDEVDYKRGVYVQRVKRAVVSISAESTSGGKPVGIFAAADKKAISDTGFMCEKAKAVTWSATAAENTAFQNPSQFVFVGSDGDTLTELQNKFNGSKILYVLADPIETPLSAEEIAAFRALHTNKPNTTIYNDAGAGLAVEYAADTKTYIDNKFTELNNAILSMGGNI